MRVRDIVASKEVDINDNGYCGDPPIYWAIKANQVDIVKYLLTQPELQLERRDSDYLFTALHWALNNVSMLQLFIQDKRCSPSIVNMKNIAGMTVLMRAVKMGSLDAVKELDKVEGTDFCTKDEYGKTLIEVARKKKRTAVLEYLMERNKKVDRLVVIAAYSLAKYVKNENDVKVLEIPHTLKPLVEGFVERDDNKNL